MLIEPLNLDHQSILEPKLKELRLSLSEYSFANLYLFRTIHRYKVIQFKEKIFIGGMSRQNKNFLMLLDRPEKLSLNLLFELLEVYSVDMLYPLPEEWAVYLSEKFGKIKKEFFSNEIKFIAEESDYLYEQSVLATFAGRHLDGKRNRLKRLNEEHSIFIQPLLSSKKEAHIVLDNWQKEREDKPEENDYFSCIEAIENLELLHLNGIIMIVDGNPAGFAIGEFLSDDICYALHFSKASHVKEALPLSGIYEYMIRETAQNLGQSAKFINFEQDLGIPALKNSKLSYHPVQLLKKCYIDV